MAAAGYIDLSVPGLGLGADNGHAGTALR